MLRIEERAGLGVLAREWDALVDLAPLPTPFLRSWWLESVCTGEPTFVLVLDGERLVGGVALQRRQRNGVDLFEMAGDGPLEPDHLDLLAAPDRVAEVIDSIERWVHRPGDRVLELRGLVDESWLRRALGPRAASRQMQVAPFTPLPAAMADYLAQRPGQVRSTITRSGKRLKSAGIVPRVRDAAEVDDALDDLRRLHDVRWGDQSRFLEHWVGFAAAMRAGAAVGDVRFTDLVDGAGRVVAIELELMAGDRACFYQAGRLEDRELRGSGSVLKAAVIERLIEEGRSEFDLLRGDESYKTEWAVASRPIMELTLGVGARGRVMNLLARARYRARVARWELAQRRAAQPD